LNKLFSGKSSDVRTCERKERFTSRAKGVFSSLQNSKFLRSLSITSILSTISTINHNQLAVVLYSLCLFISVARNPCFSPKYASRATLIKGRREYLQAISTGSFEEGAYAISSFSPVHRCQSESEDIKGTDGPVRTASCHFRKVVCESIANCLLVTREP
jgi:hypothetical protein